MIDVIDAYVSSDQPDDAQRRCCPNEAETVSNGITFACGDKSWTVLKAIICHISGSTAVGLTTSSTPRTFAQ